MHRWRAARRLGSGSVAAASQTATRGHGWQMTAPLGGAYKIRSHHLELHGADDEHDDDYSTTTPRPTLFPTQTDTREGATVAGGGRRGMPVSACSLARMWSQHAARRRCRREGVALPVFLQAVIIVHMRRLGPARVLLARPGDGSNVTALSLLSPVFTAPHCASAPSCCDGTRRCSSTRRCSDDSSCC